MLRLARYLKPFTPLIALAIVLLFVQGFADLTLPEYMGRLVNNGIQQGGVENAVPSAVRASEMDKLTLFMSAEDQATVLGDYTLIDQDLPDYDRYVAIYSVLATEPIYVLNDVDAAEIERLNPIMGRAFLAVSGIEKAMEDPSAAAALAPSGSGFDLSQLPAGTDVFQMLSPAAGRHAHATARLHERALRRVGRQHDRPVGGECGQGGVWRAGHEHRQPAE